MQYPIHEMRRLYRSLAEQPFMSLRDLSARLDQDPTVLRRLCARLVKRDLISVARLGMLQRPVMRFWSGAAGPAGDYDQSHEHPSIADINRLRHALAHGDRTEFVAEFGRHFSTVDTHSPWWDDPTDGHAHAPWTAESEGLRTVYTRLPLAELAYPVLPKLFTEGMVEVIEPIAGQRRERRLAKVQWSRRGRLYHLTATYGDDVWVGVTYIGDHITASALREKINFRFTDLDRYVDAPPHRWPPTFLDVAGEDVEPIPSLHVVVGLDRLAEEMAVDVLREHLPGDVCSLTELLAHGARAHPSQALVADPLKNMQFPARSGGRVETFEGWLRRRRGMRAIGNKAGHSVLVAVADFPGMLLSHIADTLRISRETAAVALNDLIAGNAILVEEGEHYLMKPGISILAKLSRTTVAQVMGPTGRFLRKEGRDKERMHNRAVNEFATLCARAGSRPMSGWRGEVNIPGVTQVKPDVLVYLSEGPAGHGLYMVEVERSAKYPSKVEPKLRPYRKLMAAGHDVRLLVVVLEYQARKNFAERGDGMPMAVAVLDELKKGMPAGEPDLWLRGGGQPTVVRF
ncbi:MAG: hypothetical protein OXE87_15660 [Chloroflexi bacterium]|nr:hypothetical protein [Chloroflexota bacterium]